MSLAPPVDLDRLLDPVGRCLTREVARELVELHVDPDVQARLDYLADLSTEGRLSDSERVEYETLVQAIDVVTVLQSKARGLLAGAEQR